MSAGDLVMERLGSEAEPYSTYDLLSLISAHPFLL